MKSPIALKSSGLAALSFCANKHVLTPVIESPDVRQKAQSVLQESLMNGQNFFIDSTSFFVVY